MRKIMECIEKSDCNGAFMLVLSNADSFQQLKEIFSYHYFKRIIVYSTRKEILKECKAIWKEMHREKNCLSEDITYEVYKSVQNLAMIEQEEVDFLFLDNGVIEQNKQEEIQKLAELNPTYFLGVIWEEKYKVFGLWEIFRKHSRVICIHNKKDVLMWKGASEDIELSVIFPVYNVAKYIGKCLETVTQWKAPYVEFLFVDDGSLDNSAEIIKEYQKEDSRIKLIQKENGGCASARKKGLELARGRYVGFFDPDDFSAEDMYKKLFSKAISGDYEVAYCGYNQYFENSNTIERVTDMLGEPYVYGVHDDRLIKQLMYCLRIAIWRGIYKREFLIKNQITFYEDIRRFDDLPFKVEVYARAKSVIAVPEYLYYYRLERPGQDVSCDDERLYVHFPIFQYLDDYIGKIKDRRLLDYLQVIKIQTHLWAVGKIQKKYVKTYVKKMKEDLQKNAGFLRTLLLIYRYVGKKEIWTYILAYANCAYMCKRRIIKQELREKKVTKKQVIALQRLKELEGNG